MHEIYQKSILLTGTFPPILCCEVKGVLNASMTLPVIGSLLKWFFSHKSNSRDSVSYRAEVDIESLLYICIREKEFHKVY